MTRLTYSELKERFRERITNLTTRSGEGWGITLDFTVGDRQGFINTTYGLEKTRINIKVRGSALSYDQERTLSTWRGWKSSDQNIQAKIDEIAKEVEGAIDRTKAIRQRSKNASVYIVEKIKGTRIDGSVWVGSGGSQFAISALGMRIEGYITKCENGGFTTKVNKVSYSQDHPQLIDFL